MRRSGVKRKLTGATKRLRCTEWCPVFDVEAPLCCPRVGHWEASQLQSLVLGLFVNVRFHSTLNSSLLSASSAKRNRKMLKLTAQTFFILTDLNYQVGSDVLHTTDLAAVCDFVLLLTTWHLRIRVSLLFDNMNNVACVLVEGLNPLL